MRSLALTGLALYLGAGQAVAAATPKPAPPSRPPAAAKPVGLVIEHTAASCVVAERFVKLQACIKPAEHVARAQVQFRALPTSPWYAVDMKPEGACLSAVLPKPKRNTAAIEYIVFAVDRSLGESYRPEGAPAKAFKPRVARAQGECAADSALGGLPGKSSIEVTVARDAAGQAVSATGASPQGMAGFSSDGVTLGQSASASGGSNGGGSGASANAGSGGGGGGGIPTLLIVGGAAAGGGVAVVALSRGSEPPSCCAGGGGTGGGGNGGSGGDTPPPGPGPLTGRWVGFRSENMGHISTQQNPRSGSTCTNYYDWQGTLTQNGSTLSGDMNVTFAGAECAGTTVPPSVYPGSTVSLFTVTLSGGGGISISSSDWVSMVGGAAGFGNYPLSGTYTTSSLVLNGAGPGAGENWSTTLRLRKQ